MYQIQKEYNESYYFIDISMNEIYLDENKDKHSEINISENKF